MVITEWGVLPLRKRHAFWSNFSLFPPLVFTILRRTDFSVRKNATLAVAVQAW
ncbi:MAG: hypothetical protein FWF80_08740 [Defluviitaleaceae bacterium]|nr:hypothetical protein [Defluviitaleaceae bacterium]